MELVFEGASSAVRSWHSVLQSNTWQVLFTVAHADRNRIDAEDLNDKSVNYFQQVTFVIAQVRFQTGNFESHSASHRDDERRWAEGMDQRARDVPKCFFHFLQTGVWYC